MNVAKIDEAVRWWFRTRWAALDGFGTAVLLGWGGFLFVVNVLGRDVLGAVSIVAIAGLWVDWVYLRTAGGRFSHLGAWVDDALDQVGADGYLILRRPAADEIEISGYVAEGES